MSMTKAEQLEKYLAQKRTHAEGTVEARLEDLAALHELRESLDEYQQAAIAEAKRRGIDVPGL